MTLTVPESVIGKLREAVVGLKKSKIYSEIVEPREEVLEHFQPIFSPSHIPEITEEEFRSFLVFKNNRHWTGLNRQGPRICSDMEKLRDALSILVDESKPIAGRLDAAYNMISGVGQNIATAILLVIQPDLYGVWNSRSEFHLIQFGIWPKMNRGESFGKRYEKVNQILLQLRDALKVDLWTLDSLWWYLDQAKETSIVENGGEGDESTVLQSFSLERHLHEFMRDNWERIELGKEWELYKEPGNDEAGYEYPCKVGRIDLLAKHKKKPQWLIIELKRNQSSDQTVGQITRYMGWVRKELAGKNDKVKGLIICREADENLRYALESVPDVDLNFYEVEFHLKPQE
jgi:hypothetical protein